MAAAGILASIIGAIGDIAESTSDKEVLALVKEHARRAAEACLDSLPARGAEDVRTRHEKVMRTGGEAPEEEPLD